MPETETLLLKNEYIDLLSPNIITKAADWKLLGALATLQDNPSASFSPHQAPAPSHSVLALFITKAKIVIVNVYTCSEEGTEPAQVPALPLTRTETATDIMHTYMHQERSRASSVVQFQPLAPNSASTQEAYTWKKQNYLRNAAPTLQALAIHSHKAETAITSEKAQFPRALL